MKLHAALSIAQRYWGSVCLKGVFAATLALALNNLSPASTLQLLQEAAVRRKMKQTVTQPEYKEHRRDRLCCSQLFHTNKIPQVNGAGPTQANIVPTIYHDCRYCRMHVDLVVDILAPAQCAMRPRLNVLIHELTREPRQLLTRPP
jgi:hypothetical protein